MTSRIDLTRVPVGLCLVLALLLALAAFGVHRAADRALMQPPVAPSTLAADVPRVFGTWQLLAEDIAQVGTNLTPLETTTSPYSEQLVRSYRNGDGHTVMLTLAYVAQLTPFTRPHAPDACYAGAGFDILSLQPTRLRAMEVPRMAQPLTAQHMLAQRGTRREAVTYWIRVGELYSPESLHARWHLAQARFHGESPDGILVRASTLLAVDDAPTDAHAMLDRFLADLLAASPEAARRKMRLP